MDGSEQTRALDEVISGLAERQYGVVARRQLLAIGVGEEAIEVRLASGRLHPLHPGVYAVGHRVLSQHARWMAAVLFCGPGAVLSHRSAAALWGIRASGGTQIHITSPSKSRSKGVIRRHFSVLPDDEVTERDGIPVTSVPRTIFDLAAIQPYEVEGALRQSEYHRLHDRLSLPHLLERYPRRAGSKAVRECLERRRETAGRSRSWLEEVFLPFLDRHRLPRPQLLNAWIEVGGRRFEVDCFWPGAKAIVELDGFAAHGTRTAFRDDRYRDRKLQRAGYGFVRLAPDQLEDEPLDVAADLRDLLYKRS